MSSFFFFNDTATTEIYTLSLHDALPIYRLAPVSLHQRLGAWKDAVAVLVQPAPASEERATAEAADQRVAEVVADDCAGRGDRDHRGDRVVPLRREHPERDQRRLAR